MSVFNNIPKDHLMDYELLCEWIVELRKENQLTILYLAKELGITRQRLSEIEKMKVYDFKTIIIIINYFKKSLSVLRND